MQSLLARDAEAQFAGLGGHAMREAGFHSLFDIQEIAFIGFVEILPHLPQIFRRIRQTVEAIEAFQPDVVITIDAPGFAKQVVKRIQRLRPQVKLVHYVAPSVWAYRPQRANKLAQLYDAVLCLLPIEPPYFTQAGMQAVFVGHPVVANAVQGDGFFFRQRHGLIPDAPLLALVPGSRPGEIKRHWPVFIQTYSRLRQKMPDLKAVVMCAPEVLPLLRQQPLPEGVLLLEEQAEKQDMLAACTVALVKSGTVSLEVALAHVPMVIAYQVHPASARMMRKMIQVRFVTLVNILAGREIIPECLQEFCRPDLLSAELLRLLQDEEARRYQQTHMGLVLQSLRPQTGEHPSDAAAEAVWRMVQPMGKG